MRYCVQDTITDEALRPLAGIKVLNMAYCTGVSGAAFEFIKGIRFLNLIGVRRWLQQHKH